MPNIFINESKFQNKYKIIKRVYVEGENTILTEEWILWNDMKETACGGYSWRVTLEELIQEREMYFLL